MPTAKYLIFNSKSTDSVKGHSSIIKAVYSMDPNMFSQPLLFSPAASMTLINGIKK
jgi:hypothetical protein